ncbi:hypothetical protein MP638_003518 [Amoeboaphelidium occidentale]|nr:hypothetical protein MP638_003518 [Amoeboaphelidium occidentale]
MNRSVSLKDRERAEQDLFVSVKKALNPDETAPKQKHVRVCYLFTHDFRTAQPFWNAVKSQPILSDDVQCFKALITIHKVMRDGHSSVLQDTMAEVPFFDTLARQMQYNAHRGYASLILAYVKFLKYKLEFHSMHPEFTADLDYEEYRALRKVDDPNEGYTAIMELMTLLDRLEDLQKVIFGSFRPSSNNECRISALVPLVEESYGIYKFNTSMLNAMHQSIAADDALQPLRERYIKQYSTLQKFYFECSNLRYLTSLITVPRLPSQPTDFLNKALPRSKSQMLGEAPREKTPEAEDIWGSVSSITPEPWTQLDQNSQMILHSQQQVTHHYNDEKENELNNLRQQNFQAQQLLHGYQARINEMEAHLREYEQMRQSYEQQLYSKQGFDAERERRDRERDTLIASLQEQVAMWKTKYENIAKMYAQLRKEHLDLLQKYKETQTSMTSVTAFQKEKEQMASQLQMKTAEFGELVKEKEKYKNDLELQKDHYAAELTRLTRSLGEQKARFDELSKSKGAETQSLVAKYEEEKIAQEARFKQQFEDFEKLKSELMTLKSAWDQSRTELQAKDNELLTLKSAMDQSLHALEHLQQKNSDQTASLMGKMDQLSLEHRSQMDKIMDSVLEDCKNKSLDSLYELENPSNPGNQNATPELVLSLIEKLTFNSNDFSSSFTKHLTSGDTTGEHQAEAIRHANLLAQAVYTILNNAKGLTRLSGDEKGTEAIINAAKSIAQQGKSYFSQLQSRELNQTALPNRPQKVQDCNGSFLSALQPMIKVTEGLVQKSVEVSKEEDLSSFVDNELTNAAKSIEEAAALLAKLLGAPRDPKLTQTDVQVHNSILESVKSITDAIARLIICATHSQQEIVANGKGTGSSAAFYKKNSRWMEGLISAAKAVATATRFLVDTADGVVHGTKSMEQLLVSAHEVSSSVAQLVAASRVKSIRGSKTQDKLELASKAVTDACKLLLDAAEKARAQSAKDKEVVVEYDKLTPHELKKREMEQQVHILTLEKTLQDARKKLGEMRRVNYHQGGDYINNSAEKS